MSLSVQVSVDPVTLLIRTIIETLAGLILLYLILTQRKWASVFLELSILCAVTDRTLILLHSPLATHDVLTTISSIMILSTVIARVIETKSITDRCREILGVAVDSIIKEKENSGKVGDGSASEEH
jgi:hypothetical protein